MWIAVLCALTGAVLSAVGAALQHAGVRDVGDLTVRRFTRLVGNRRWLLGFSVLVVAAVPQVLALAPAPVTVVNPIVAASIGMALLDEALDAGPGTVAALVASAAVALTGTARFHHRRSTGRTALD